MAKPSLSHQRSLSAFLHPYYSQMLQPNLVSTRHNILSSTYDHRPHANGALWHRFNAQGLCLVCASLEGAEVKIQPLMFSIKSRLLGLKSKEDNKHPAACRGQHTVRVGLQHSLGDIQCNDAFTKTHKTVPLCSWGYTSRQGRVMLINSIDFTVLVVFTSCPCFILTDNSPESHVLTAQQRLVLFKSRMHS